MFARGAKGTQSAFLFRWLDVNDMSGNRRSLHADSRLRNSHSRIEYLANFRHDVHLEVSDSM